MTHRRTAAWLRDVLARLCGNGSLPLTCPAADEVLLSQDLLPLLMTGLELEDAAARRVCKVWLAAWVSSQCSRRLVRSVRLSHGLSFPDTPVPSLNLNLLVGPRSLALLPDGRLCFGTMNRLHIVDREMRHLTVIGAVESPRLPTFEGILAIATGDNSLFVADSCSWLGLVRLRRLHADSFIVLATCSEPAMPLHRLLVGRDHPFRLAAGPGVLFAVADAGSVHTYGEGRGQICAFDPQTLRLRATFCLARFSGGRVQGVAVVGQELFVVITWQVGADHQDNFECLHVYSLCGHYLRKITVPSWSAIGVPRDFCCVGRRLYFIDSSCRRIVVLSLEGHLLQIHEPHFGPLLTISMRGLSHGCGCLLVHGPEFFYSGFLLELSGL